MTRSSNDRILTNCSASINLSDVSANPQDLVCRTGLSLKMAHVKYQRHGAHTTPSEGRHSQRVAGAPIKIDSPALPNLTSFFDPERLTFLARFSTSLSTEGTANVELPCNAHESEGPKLCFPTDFLVTTTSILLI